MRKKAKKKRKDSSNYFKKPSSLFIITLFLIFTFLVIQNAQYTWAEIGGKELGKAALGGVAAGYISAAVVLIVILAGVPIAGWIAVSIIVLAVAVTVAISLLASGGEDPEPADDQGDGSDLLEDKDDLSKVLEKDRRLTLVKARCDGDVPLVSGSFQKRALRTTNEYTYSYTLAACDKAKAFFCTIEWYCWINENRISFCA